MFMDRLPVDIESVINEKFKSYAYNNDVGSDIVIDAYIIPYKNLSIVGTHGVNGVTFGYFDVVFYKGGTIKDWSLISSTSAYETASKFYDVEHWL